MKEIRIRVVEDVIEFRDIYEVLTVINDKVASREVFYTKSDVAEYIEKQG